MKTKLIRFSLMLTLLSALNPQLPTLFAQGSLTPPGAPTPTMKTLDQIEPRTPISSMPFTISTPGSYFVTTNLTGVAGQNGITIATSNVVLDLHGFTLTGVPGSTNGIYVAGNNSEISIKNGTVTSWGLMGVNANNSGGGQFIRVNTVANNDDGLDPGGAAQVSDCESHDNIGNGFGGVCSRCQFANCIAHDNHLVGFSTFERCLFVNCTAADNGTDGFNPFYDCTLQDCVANGNGFEGIDCAYDGCLFAHCVCGYNDGIGILAGDDCTVRDSNTSNNGDDGIVTGSSSVIESCTASENSSGGIIASNYCTINGCVAGTNQLDNMVTAYGCTLSHCSAGGSATGNGFTLGSGNTILGSSAMANGINGINAGDRTTIQSCTANFNGNAGIHVTYLGNVQQCSCFNNGVYGILSDANGYASILNNNCSFNGLLTFSGFPSQGAGIYITNSPGCRVEANTLNVNLVALVVAANNHAFILRNSAQGNFSTSYSIASGNSWGPIVDVSAGGDISGVANSSHPDANFIH